jgi:outer membrane protein assembly factor BamB
VAVVLVSCGTTPQTPGPPAAAPSTLSPTTPTIVPSASAGLPPLADIPFYRSDVFGRLLDPGPGPTGRPELAWKSGFRTSNVWPLLVDGLLIAGMVDGPAVALDARTGEERWRFAPKDGITQSIASADGLVVLDGPQAVYAVDVQTGDKRWEAAVDTPFRGVIVDGVVYVASMAGAVGLSETTGKRVWEWSGPKGLKSTVVRVADGVAFISAGDGRIYAIDIATGVERWPAVESTSLNPGGVEIVGDTLYTGAVQADPVALVGQLSAIDRASGRVRWTFRSPSGYQINAGAVRDGVLYVGGARDGMYALRDDGDRPTTLWHIAAPTSWFAPVLVGDTLYVQREDGSIGAYDTKGQMLWATASLNSAGRGPLVSGGMIFSENDAGVMAFADPSLIARLPTPSHSSAPSPTAPPPSAPDPFAIVKAMPLADAGLAIPLSLSVGPDNLVYVLDTKPSVTVIDPRDWRVVHTWGRQGAAPGEFDLTRPDDNPGFGDIVVGPSGRVYVADGSNHRIQVFEPDGTPVAQYGRFGTGPGQFGSIGEIALDHAENIYVLDGSANSLTKLTHDGRFIWRDEQAVVGGASPGYLHGPVIRPDGKLLVGCEGCQGSLVIDPSDGRVVGTFGSSFVDGATGWFDRAGAFDTAGNLYGDTWLPPDRGADVVIAPNGDVIGIRFGTLTDIGRDVHHWGTSFYPKLAFGPDGLIYTFDDQGLIQVKVSLPRR